MSKSSKVLIAIRLLVYPTALFLLVVFTKEELQWMRIKRQMAESAAGLEVLTRDIERARKEIEAELAPKLRIDALRCSQNSVHIIVSGLVTNISGEAIQANAVGSIYDSEGTFLASDSEVLEYHPIYPGQSSPFHTYLRLDPAFVSCSVGFRAFSGKKIMTIDAPPTTTTKPKRKK